MAYKQAKISNKCAECCCPSFAHVSKGTLFTIFLLADISDDNKHLAFEVTTKVAFITSIICMTADFQNGLISRIFGVFSSACLHRTTLMWL